MNSWWYAWNSEISNEDCDKIKSLFVEKGTQIGKVGDKDHDKSIRDSKVIGFPYGSKENIQINKVLEKYINLANAECFGFHLNGVCEFQIAEYSYGGHYDNHFDMRMDNRSSSRKLSITVQLSESHEYEGGEFYFTDDIGTPDQDYLRNKGSILIFPSFLYHRVKPVIKGKRYSLVGWYEGNNWV